MNLAYDITGDGRTVVRAGWGLYFDAFSQDFFVGQLPFNTFNPGPAYNGVGPSPIAFSFSPTATIVSGQPVFDASSFSASDVFTVDQKLVTPYVHNFNVNVEQPARRSRGGAGGLRRIGGAASLPLSRHQPGRSAHRRASVRQRSVRS